MPSDRAITRSLGFFSACSCYGSSPCSCRNLPSIELPADHVHTINSVHIGGEPIDPSSYTLRDNYLIRIDGESWPCCDTEDFIISFSSGVAPPPTGVTAAAVLACELYMACDPSTFGSACRLPANIQTVSRQGVSVLLASFTRTRSTLPFRFGILEIDLFLETYAPRGQRSQSVVISPDTIPTAQRVK